MKTYKCIITETVEFEIEVLADNEREAEVTAIDTHLCGVSDQCGPPEREVVRVEEVGR